MLYDLWWLGSIGISRNKEYIWGRGGSGEGRGGITWGFREVSSYFIEDKLFYLLEMCGWVNVIAFFFK